MGDYDNILVSRLIFPIGRDLHDYDPKKTSKAGRKLKFQEEDEADQVLSTPGGVWLITVLVVVQMVEVLLWVLSYSALVFALCWLPLSSHIASSSSPSQEPS